jgi:hypothetical protein
MTKKFTIEYVRNELEKRNCKLLQDSYKGNDKKLKILFSCGHQGLRSFNKFRQGLSICSRCSGVEQYTFDEVYNCFKENNYDLLSKEYKTCKDKIIFKDSEGYKFITSFDKFLHNILGRGCLPNRYHLFNPFTIENIELFLSKNYPVLKLIPNQKWKGGGKYLEFEDEVGYKYSIRFDTIQSHYSKVKNLPPICYASNKHSLDNVKLYLKLNNKEFHLIDNQKYIHTRSKLLFKCHKCHPDEIPFKANWTDIERGVGCGLCVNSQIGNYNTLLYEYPLIAKEWDFEKNYPVTPDKVSPHSSARYFWICPDCLNSYESTICHRTNGEPRGCPVCNESNGEKRIRKFLEDNNIEFIPQYKFENCRNILPLPFDFSFYINNEQILCEYQGLQHYEPVNRFGGEKEFKISKKRDKIKLEYCKDNNIKLIEIPYWDFKNIESILQTNLLGKEVVVDKS